MTLNGLGKNYNQFQTNFKKHFLIFQKLITLFISEEKKIVGISSNEGSKESAFYSNTNRGKDRGGRTSSQGQHRNSHGEVQIL